MPFLRTCRATSIVDVPDPLQQPAACTSQAPQLHLGGPDGRVFSIDRREQKLAETVSRLACRWCSSEIWRLGEKRAKNLRPSLLDSYRLGFKLGVRKQA